MKLFCISGFLGLADDWNVLRDLKLEVSPHAAQEFLDGGIDKINEMGREEKADVICGYSLGGRLALQAFLKPESHWRAAIIISAHPGLQTTEEKTQRMENDRIWAERFLKTPWKELLAQWNEQTAFAGKPVPLALQREEKHFKRNELAALLTEFSLGWQRDLRGELSQCQKPILFVAGFDDLKFSKLAAEMTTLNSQFDFALVAGAGHRVLWEADKKELENLVRRFENL